MYLFSRSRRLDPAHGRAGMAYAVEAGQKASQITGLDIGVWAEVFSPGLGTISWATMAPDLLALEQSMDKLAVADDFMSTVEANASLFSGFGEDHLYQLVHGEPDPERRPSYAIVVRGRCQAGRLVEGIELGAELAQRITDMTGDPTMFATAATGAWGEVMWLTSYDGIERAQASEATLMADPDWLTMLDDRAAGAYESDATQTMYRRLV